jgi:hypothetical protein
MNHVMKMMGVKLHAFLTSELNGMDLSGQIHASAALPQGTEPRYQMIRMLSGPLRRSECSNEEKKYLPRRE